MAPCRYIPVLAAPGIAEPFQQCWRFPLKPPASPHLHFPPSLGCAAVPVLSLLSPTPAVWPVPPRPSAALPRASLPHNAGRCLDISLCLGQPPTGTVPLMAPPAAPRALTHQAMLGPWGSALSFSFPGVREASAVLHMTGGRKRAGTSKCGATVALDLPADSARPLSLLQKPSAASAQGSPPGGHSSVKRLPHL